MSTFRMNVLLVDMGTCLLKIKEQGARYETSIDGKCL